MIRTTNATVEVTIHRASKVRYSDGEYVEAPDLLIRTEKATPGPWDPPHTRGTVSSEREAERLLQGLWACLSTGVLVALAQKLVQRLKDQDLWESNNVK